MSIQRACDVCHFYRQRPDGTAGVQRYGLRSDKRLRRPPFTGPQRMVGSIDLCDQCWERIAKPRMSAAKSAEAYKAWERRKAAA